MDKTLKPNGISHTVYPDNPAKNYNEWMEHITASIHQARRGHNLSKSSTSCGPSSFKQIEEHNKQS